MTATAANASWAAAATRDLLATPLNPPVSGSLHQTLSPPSLPLAPSSRSRRFPSPFLALLAEGIRRADFLDTGRDRERPITGVKVHLLGARRPIRPCCEATTFPKTKQHRQNSRQAPRWLNFRRQRRRRAGTFQNTFFFPQISRLLAAAKQTESPRRYTQFFPSQSEQRTAFYSRILGSFAPIENGSATRFLRKVQSPGRGCPCRWLEARPETRSSGRPFTTFRPPRAPTDPGTVDRRPRTASIARN